MKLELLLWRSLAWFFAIGMLIFPGYSLLLVVVWLQEGKWAGITASEIFGIEAIGTSWRGIGELARIALAADMAWWFFVLTLLCYLPCMFFWGLDQDFREGEQIRADAEHRQPKGGTYGRGERAANRNGPQG